MLMSKTLGYNQGVWIKLDIVLDDYTYRLMYVCVLIQQGTSGPSHKPLKCRVMHHKVIAHQMCAVQMLGWLNKITNYSGLLK